MITPEELDYIRTAAIRDMLGDSKALDVREHRFDDLMDKIRHWLGECEEMLERRPVSSQDRLGAHRKAADRPFPHRLRAAEIPARAVHPLGRGNLLCPYPARGRPGHMPVWYGKAVRRKNAAGAITNRYPWRYLYTVVERLAEGLEATIPEVAELGTEIYLTVQN